MTRMRSRFKNIGLKLIALMAVLFVAAIVAYTQKSPAARQRPPKTMPDPPRILSFTSTPERIQAGESQGYYLCRLGVLLS
jgi:hypothetical protein